ncbi:hypothetical protein D3C72_1899420 [compost metagenome]
MQALDQQRGWPLTQHRHHADAVFSLPDKLYRLVFQLLIEAMAVQRVFTNAGTYQRHQRQAFAQLQLTRQPRVLQRVQDAVHHFGGVAQLNQTAVRMNPYRQRFDLRALKHQIQLLLRQFKIMLTGNLQLNQTHVVMAGDDLRTGARGQHAFDTR